MIDLTSACQRTSDVLVGVTDEQLALPTPCEKLRLDALIAHVGMLASAFAAAGAKDFGPMTDTPPVDGAQVEADWRTSYPRRLAELAEVWRDPDAWGGMTRAGGIDLDRLRFGHQDGARSLIASHVNPGTSVPGDSAAGRAQ
jgi:uncharacterized protein (TIGR03086 family)